MNRLILKYSYPFTFAILAILAWFIYRQFIVMKSPLFPFLLIVGFVWVAGTFLFIYFWPAITCNGYKRAILQRGLGGGPIPLNTLYAVPTSAAEAGAGSSLMATGTNDLLYIGGWLDLSKGPLVLQVPDFSGRYYSIQFTDPIEGSDFAYVGKRATGTRAGKYLITGPGWQGEVPQGMKHIFSPHNEVMVLGRALLNDKRDVKAVYELTKQVQIRPFA